MKKGIRSLLRLHSEHGNSLVSSAIIIGVLVILLTWFLRENIFLRFASQEAGFHEAVISLSNSDLDIISIDEVGNLVPSEGVILTLVWASQFVQTTTGADEVRIGLFVNQLSTSAAPGAPKYDSWSPAVDSASNLTCANNTEASSCPLSMLAILPVFTSGSPFSENVSYRLVIEADYAGLSSPMIAEVPVQQRRPGSSFPPVAPPGASGVSGTPGPTATTT